MTIDTLKVRQDGAAWFADIAAQPMNLPGPELVRDRVSLIQSAEADDTLGLLFRRLSASLRLASQSF